MSVTIKYGNKNVNIRLENWGLENIGYIFAAGNIPVWFSGCPCFLDDKGKTDFFCIPLPPEKMSKSDCIKYSKQLEWAYFEAGGAEQRFVFLIKKLILIKDKSKENIEKIVKDVIYCLRHCDGYRVI